MTKKNVAALPLALCLATTFLSSGSFAGDPELYFYPKLKWTVEQINSGTTDELATCTLSNQMNNGYIIQLAGNAEGFTNLNIDFRQNVFKENIKYEVQYSVPGITQQVIPTKAFRKNLLVSDLRKEKPFAQNLQNASVLDVTIQKNAFRLYLTGLQAALKDFDDCIGTGATQMSSASGTIDMTETPAQSEAIDVNVDYGNRAAPPPTIELSQPEQKTQPEQLQAEALRPEKTDKPRYTQILAEKMKEESAKYKPEEDQHNAADDVANTEPEATAAPLNAAAEESAIAQIEKPAPKTKTVEKFSSPKVKYNITKPKEPIVADLTEQHATSEVDVQNIEPAAGIAGDEFIQMRNKIAQLEKEVNSLSSENSMLNEELKIALTESQQEKLSVSSNNWNLEMATMKFNEAERQIMRLGRQLQTHKAACQQEKSDLERMLFDPQLTDQKQLAKLASLEGELDNTKQELERQKRLYEERIRILEGQLTSN